eukprot:3483750-Rhodomonas_salina.1
MERPAVGPNEIEEEGTSEEGGIAGSDRADSELSFVVSPNGIEEEGASEERGIAGSDRAHSEPSFDADEGCDTLLDNR